MALAEGSLVGVAIELALDPLQRVPKDEGKTASGLPTLLLPITKSGKLCWSMTLATRGDFKSVEANWHNEETGQKEREGDRG